MNIDILYKKGLAELPEEIGVVYHLQQILVYILPVSHHQCSLLCAGVLVRQHPKEKERCQQTRKLALYIGGREKDPEQAAVHHGQ